MSSVPGGGTGARRPERLADLAEKHGDLLWTAALDVEGFFESVMLEVAAFGIGITLVEPGVARTGFGHALDVAPALAAYADTPVGQLRRYVEAPEGVTAGGPGDPDKVADAILASVDVSPAPRRLTLGSDAYQSMHAALTGRIGELEAGRDIAFSTDFAGARQTEWAS
ncbi:hypothetical protein ACTXG6_03255 [Pseudonocardia sp. Cha107L01]|uniref:hypothetical protein n=1 Tax=Pseudonocardia sp. Cha107L01 TaxID=3457576 RepID=UPI00403E9224